MSAPKQFKPMAFSSDHRLLMPNHERRIFQQWFAGLAGLAGLAGGDGRSRQTNGRWQRVVWR